MDTPLIKPPLGASMVAASIAVNVLGLALPLVMLQIFDRVIPNQAIETLLVLIIGLIVAILLDFSLKVCRVFVATHLGEEFDRKNALEIAHRMLNTSPKAIDLLSDMERFEATTAVTQLRDHYCGEGRLALIDLPFAVFFVLAVALVGGELALVLIASFALLIVMSVIFRSKQKCVYAERKSIDKRRYAFFGEFLSKIHVIKSNCMETPMLRRYELLQDQSVAASKRLITVNGMSQAFSATMSQATIGAMALTGGAMVINGSLGIAELAACTLLGGRAIQPMFKLTSIWIQGESANAAKQRCGELLSLPQRDNQTNPVLLGAISFESVALKLKDYEKPLFEGVSFKCEPGECIALTGDDGAGKTTFLRLIMGEQLPSGGHVKVDGRPATEFLGARGNGGIAYLDQKPVIFDTTIMQNLMLSHDPAHAEKVIELSDTLGLSEAINRLPKGYETLIGGKGAMPLPEGILQLIALVRALSKSPKVVLFNEANTAMDGRTDNETLNAIRNLKGQTTLVLVSRRPSFIEIADRQINLVEGGVTIHNLNNINDSVVWKNRNTGLKQFSDPIRMDPLSKGLSLAEATT